jgi:hypothetical protein
VTGAHFLCFAAIGAALYFGVQAVRGFDASRFDRDGRS